MSQLACKDSEVLTSKNEGRQEEPHLQMIRIDIILLLETHKHIIVVEWEKQKMMCQG